MLINLNEFLMGVAGISATLIGTFIVGVFFYIDTDLHRRLMESDAADRHLRSNVRWVLAVYALPMLLSLVLAAFEPIWGALAFIVLSAVVVLCTIDTGRRMLRRRRIGDSFVLVLNQWASSAAVVALVALPWLIGGWVPPVSAYIPSIVLALAAGFASTAANIMTQFDATAAMMEEMAAAPEPVLPPPRPRARRARAKN